MKVIVAIIAVGAICAGCGQRTDPALVEAYRQARNSLPEFISALQAPKTNEILFTVHVYLPSKETGQLEPASIHVNKFEGHTFSGSAIGAYPHLGLSLNQPVTVDASNVYDWCYMDLKKGVVGAFTSKFQKSQ
jgi:hypothetical protein